MSATAAVSVMPISWAGTMDSALAKVGGVRMTLMMMMDGLDPLKVDGAAAGMTIGDVVAVAVNSVAIATVGADGVIVSGGNFFFLEQTLSSLTIKYNHSK